MLTIDMKASNPSEVIKFLLDSSIFTGMDFMLAQPREDNKLDIYLSNKAENVEIKIIGVFTKDAEGIAAVCELMKIAGFRTSTINQISSMTEIEKFGVIK